MDVDQIVDSIVEQESGSQPELEQLKQELEDFVYDYWQDVGPDLGGETKEALEKFKLHVMDRLSDKYGDQWPEVRGLAKQVVKNFGG